MALRFFPVGVAVVLVTGAVQADDSREACIEASTEGQGLRDNGQLVEASEMLRRCAEPDCPLIVRSYCTTWLAQVEERIPSMRVVVPDGDGDVRVWLDGNPVPPAPEDGSWRLNPGEHLLVVEGVGAGHRVEEKVWLSEREKGRLVQLRWPAKQRPETEATETRAMPARAEARAVRSDERRSYAPPFGVWVLGGIGIAALGSSTYFGLSALRNVNDMRNSCAPDCSSAQVGESRTQALVADVSLGVGTALLVGAAVWWILSRGIRSSDKTASVDVYPVVAQGGLETALARGHF